MSERILKALMQLFAIVAKIDVIEESDEIVAADSSKNIVEILLKQDLTSELVVKYLKIFDEFIKERHGTKRAKDSKKKRTSVNQSRSGHWLQRVGIKRTESGNRCLKAKGTKRERPATGVGGGKIPA